MRSRLYVGTLMHRRTRPVAYQFQHDVFYMGIDLEEIEDLDRRLKLFSYNRTNVLSLLDRDHLDDEPIAPAMSNHLAAAGWDAAGGNVCLLTNPRTLRYVFNPVSFYLCHTATGALDFVVAEVHNTSGERHVYNLDRQATPEGIYSAEVDKDFYVSPFIGMEGRYAFHLSECSGRLRIQIDEFDDEARPFFQAELRLRALPLTNSNLHRLLLRYPLMTLKTIALIHWHGLKLWLRGVPYRKNPHTAARRS